MEVLRTGQREGTDLKKINTCVCVCMCVIINKLIAFIPVENNEQNVPGST